MIFLNVMVILTPSGSSSTVKNEICEPDLATWNLRHFYCKVETANGKAHKITAVIKMNNSVSTTLTF